MKAVEVSVAIVEEALLTAGEELRDRSDRLARAQVAAQAARERAGIRLALRTG